MFLLGSGLGVEFLQLSLSLASAPLCLLRSGSPVLQFSAPVGIRVQPVLQRIIGMYRKFNVSRVHVSTNPTVCLHLRPPLRSLPWLNNCMFSFFLNSHCVCLLMPSSECHAHPELPLVHLWLALHSIILTHVLTQLRIILSPSSRCKVGPTYRSSCFSWPVSSHCLLDTPSSPSTTQRHLSHSATTLAGVTELARYPQVSNIFDKLTGL